MITDLRNRPLVIESDFVFLILTRDTSDVLIIFRNGCSTFYCISLLDQ